MGFAKKIDGHGLFLLDQFMKKKSFFGGRKWRRPTFKAISLGVIDLDRSDAVLVNEGLEVGGIERFFSLELVHPTEGLQKVFGNRPLQVEKEPRNRRMERSLPGDILHPLEGGKGFLDILLKVLNENDCFSFQQEKESIFSSIDLQKPVDDEDDKNDPGEDSQIDR